jgi:hypothetical protein
MQRESGIYTYIQTRSDSSRGKWMGTEMHESIKAAYRAWTEDKNIWKISFSSSDNAENDTRYQCITHTKTETWSWSPETNEKLKSLNPIYANASNNQLFWLIKTIMPSNLAELKQSLKDGMISDAEFEKGFDLGCYVGILTDEEFRNKYC